MSGSTGQVPGQDGAGAGAGRLPRFPGTNSRVVGGEGC